MGVNNCVRMGVNMHVYLQPCKVGGVPLSSTHESSFLPRLFLLGKNVVNMLQLCSRFGDGGDA
jgi:hypothetical protein